MTEFFSQLKYLKWNCPCGLNRQYIKTLMIDSNKKNHHYHHRFIHLVWYSFNFYQCHKWCLESYFWFSFFGFYQHFFFLYSPYYFDGNPLFMLNDAYLHCGPCRVIWIINYNRLNRFTELSMSFHQSEQNAKTFPL